MQLREFNRGERHVKWLTNFMLPPKCSLYVVDTQVGDRRNETPNGRVIIKLGAFRDE
jgi:hypothetical protein